MIRKLKRGSQQKFEIQNSSSLVIGFFYIHVEKKNKRMETHRILIEKNQSTFAKNTSHISDFK